MVFSSPIFLFLFLPIVLTVYALLPGPKNQEFLAPVGQPGVYAWGQVDFILLLLASTLTNYGLGLWVDRSAKNRQSQSRPLPLRCSVNIGLLAFFKYADFAVRLFNSALNLAGHRPDSCAAYPAADWHFIFHLPRIVVRD